MTAPRLPAKIDPRRNRRVAILAAGLVCGMVGLSYASVPLYRMFCQATGYGGTTQRADAAPGAAGDQLMEIRFDANTASGINWEFKPEQVAQNVKLGEQSIAFYRARNLSQHEVTGTAVFNVTPAEAGAYFNKIQCFCFTEQTLAPGQTADMPVVFFVDPEIAKDVDLAKLKTITLSYTFYPTDTPASLSKADAPAAKVTTN